MNGRKRAFSYVFLLSFLVTLSLGVEKAYILPERIRREVDEKYFLFVLREYAFACYKYKTYYGRYPISLSQLKALPPAPTFLRKFYRDPWSDTTEKFVDNTNFGWRLVKVAGRGGGIIGVRSRSNKLSLSYIPYSKYYYDEKLVLHGKPVTKEGK